MILRPVPHGQTCGLPNSNSERFQLEQKTLDYHLYVQMLPWETRMKKKIHCYADIGYRINKTPISFLGLKVPKACQNLGSPNRDLTAFFCSTWPVLGRGGWHFLLLIYLHLLGSRCIYFRQFNGYGEEGYWICFSHLVLLWRTLDLSSNLGDSSIPEMIAYSSKFKLLRRGLCNECLLPLSPRYEEKHNTSPNWKPYKCVSTQSATGTYTCWAISALLMPFALPMIVNRSEVFLLTTFFFFFA